MSKFHLLLTAGAAAGLSGCFGGDEQIVIDEPGAAIEQTREVGAFDEIGVAGPYRVIVADGEPGALTISGPENVLEHTEIEVENGELKIRMEKGYRTKWRWSDEDAVEIRFSHNALKEAAIGGSGSIDIERSSVERFEGAIGGSGTLTIARLAAVQSEFAIGGSGDIRVSGATETLEVSIGGSGEFISPDFEASEAEIAIGGSGDVEARVTGKATVSIAGSGDVAISGGAECSVAKAGSGNVTCS